MTLPHGRNWALAIGAPAIKEARTTRVAGPHAEFQTSGARSNAARRNLRPSGTADGASFGRISIPLRHATVNAISCRYANGCLPYSRRARRSVRRRTGGSSCKVPSSSRRQLLPLHRFSPVTSSFADDLRVDAPDSGVLQRNIVDRYSRRGL